MKTALLLTGAIASAGAADTAVMFKETFDDITKWTSSKWKSDSEMGEFKNQASSLPIDNKDKGLCTTEDARFYGTSTNFKDFSVKGKSFLVQYEVTMDKDVECGGGYLKMGPKVDDLTKFGGDTDYALMFGPDKCGYTKRTHLIFNYKGKNVLKKTDLPYKQDDGGQITSVYRLVVTPENKVTVRINDEEVYSGSMEADWDLIEAKEIDDPESKKPEDWVDDEMMDDPEDTKPAEWVEEKEIVDAAASKPEDWDEEEDGEWEAPMVANPDFKGDWSAKRINNPGYKGVWAPARIPNPKYEEDSELYLMNKKDVGFVGFDLWQVKGGTCFDNLIIASHKDEKELVKEADAAVDAWKTTKDQQQKDKDSTTTTTTTEAPSADAPAADADADDSEDKDDDGKDDDDDL